MAGRLGLLAAAAALLVALAGISPCAASKAPFFALSARTLDGQGLKFSRFEGNNVVLIANVASQCGFTDAGYEGLVHLHNRFGNEGLKVLAFPCNQFGQQEPADSEEIGLFAEERGVKFGMMEKVEVNGETAHPVFKFLTQSAEDSGPIYWNFEYFLVDHTGRVANRYRTGIDLASPEVEDEIEELLAKLPRHHNGDL